MPAIRGIYRNHPQTGEAGLWVWLAYGDQRIIGLTETQITKLGNTVAKRAPLLKTALQTVSGEEIVIEVFVENGQLNWTIAEGTSKAVSV